MILSDKQRKIINEAKSVIVCQAENPDGDSVGSALALEELLSEMDKEVYLHCPVQVPTYLRYLTVRSQGGIIFKNRKTEEQPPFFWQE